MTQLLVSVRDLAEAELAYACQVDIIDVKEPAHGSLGAAAAEVRRAIAANFAGKTRLSAAAGELYDWLKDMRSPGEAANPSGPYPATTSRDEAWVGYTWAKMGLSGCRNSDWQGAWRNWQASLPPTTQGVLVCYVDGLFCRAPQPLEVLKFAQEAQIPAITLDTYYKEGFGLFHFWQEKQLRNWANKLKKAGILAVAAGKLKLRDVRILQDYGYNVVAVRGGVCKAAKQSKTLQRLETLDDSAVRIWRRECNLPSMQSPIDSLSTLKKKFSKNLKKTEDR